MNHLRYVLCLSWISLACTATIFAQPIPLGEEISIVQQEDGDIEAIQQGASIPTPSSLFVGITPCRVVDTRGGGFGGQYGPPRLTNGVPRDIVLIERCGVPANALAVSMNVTAILPTGVGNLKVFPKGGVVPTVSTVNFREGQNTANAALVPLGDDGAITIVSSFADSDVVIDVNGYFLAPPAGAALVKIFGVSNVQCAQAMAKLDAFTGNTSGFSAIGTSQVYLANDGSWFYRALVGDCSPMTNAPTRAFAFVPVDLQGAIVRPQPLP